MHLKLFAMIRDHCNQLGGRVRLFHFTCNSTIDSTPFIKKITSRVKFDTNWPKTITHPHCILTLNCHTLISWHNGVETNMQYNFYYTYLKCHLGIMFPKDEPRPSLILVENIERSKEFKLLLLTQVASTNSNRASPKVKRVQLLLPTQIGLAQRSREFSCFYQQVLLGLTQNASANNSWPG